MVNELANLNQQLLQLKEILRKQLSLTSGEQSEEALESLERLESSKRELHAVISESVALVAQLSVDTSATTNTVQLLNSMNEEIQLNIIAWSDGSSVEMKNIKDQRKTLQTYGGVAPGEVVSYYIDFKN
ncbi:MAG: hypothetical protein NAG76_07675 [Candidatus Pristimantibacillus lignocellulolyticus]|uniref:Uncharacterized protein n=1 Tax=Candidatus Pristimantibacillus lignocellulolyticus TaxID=2994561 RepID=A0A9J6ZIS4_9BACL|nr:MAG: hypothetical protein NAG76_07675 [Candidatus Pristimantibacillus lignocellulolyticus]